ncbi:MAG: 4-(cytidine 5'-diphospho)-2-C-methyl-D-erythritol kinase [Ginsengibacter sp.]
MITFPNCKINLGLHILRKRDDGYHDLDTFFYPVGLCDILEIIHSPSASIEFVCTGLPFSSESTNLCVLAFHVMKKDFPSIGGIQMHLHKVIPIGSGLGGGSADAAFVITMMNKLFDLQLTKNQMLEYASQLGSDCAFFMINRPAYASGRGELLSRSMIDLSSYKIVLVNPGIMISTSWAFSKVEPAVPEVLVQDILQQSIAHWKKQLKNDFEFPVFAEYPMIKEIKEDLYRQGALYASLSGSGSTVFGIFEKEASINARNWKDYFYKVI